MSFISHYVCEIMYISVQAGNWFVIHGLTLIKAVMSFYVQLPARYEILMRTYVWSIFIWELFVCCRSSSSPVTTMHYLWVWWRLCPCCTPWSTCFLLYHSCPRVCHQLNRYCLHIYNHLPCLGYNKESQLVLTWRLNLWTINLYEEYFLSGLLRLAELSG